MALNRRLAPLEEGSPVEAPTPDEGAPSGGALVDAAAASHVGHGRSRNEDAFIARPNSRLYLVCDGAGGQQGGEMAATVARDTVERALRREQVFGQHPLEPEAAMEAMRRAFRAAHSRVRAESVRLQLDKPAAASMVALLVLEELVVVASIGICRAYLISARGYRRLTTEHTVAERCADLGFIGRSEVVAHPLRKVLDRAIGGENGGDPDLTLVPFRARDRLLLCSDGLWRAMPEAELLEMCGRRLDVCSLVSAVVAKGLGSEAADDMTAVLVERRRAGRGAGAAQAAPVRRRQTRTPSATSRRRGV